MKTQSTARSLSKFLVVGVTTSGVYFGLFYVLWSWLNINYTVAISIAYTIAIFFHFNANRYFTFQSHGSGMIQHVSRYTMMTIINYLITIGVVRIFVTSHFSPYTGMVAAIIINLAVSYLMSRFWVFNLKAKEL